MSEDIDHHRRGFFWRGHSDHGRRPTRHDRISCRTAQQAKAARNQAGHTHTTFASLKQIDAGLLNVGYAEAGPANGPAVMLLHGWPYDIHSFAEVTPFLASKGYRVIVP